ncbi:hypothetical protein O3G_MSEX009263 [Manduca sexta]|uniref:Uncharacterized protein n=1 Tax=Manduca sexta TaxID=7130 RepID=A0A921ZCR9_MANSE|nr:hypothetical protein O3G_MSEX009263 [Manduca sexta]KAG6455575.1 hypothetical protein O3G_MSEX009263 [Manduca sexta]KAG6455576.1 hypothetical protein O3G_MSEX009263 [Manduca sexta]KAG6455577.1 hypothetical protein O3G_MSEX009263 [Manduca sexta]KAG6455578.1 hypothetical protein O3G_MSEX009263 [Manduca sexta]
MDYISGWCKSQRRLDGYTVIITGSNGGIGKATASDLYSRGARVIMACRNIEKAEKAKKEIIKENVCKAQMGSLAIEYLDLCSLKSIRSCANRILEKEPNINILINNAGVMMCPESKTEDGFEKQFGSNHLGHAYLTLLLLPRLIKSAPSRIIFVSSLLHCIYTENFDDINYEGSSYSSLFAYACSKTANIVFAKALAMKLKVRKILQ